MSSQDRKYFRFSRILVLLILFISPTTSATNTLDEPECFPKLENALKTSQSDEFKKIAIECLSSVDWNLLSYFAMHKFQRLIEIMPPEIAESAHGVILIVSLDLISFNNQLYQQAVLLAEEVKQQRLKYELIKIKVGVTQKAIKELFHSMSKTTKFAILYKKITKIMEFLNNFDRALEEITDEVKKGIINSRHSKPSAVGYGITAVAVCITSISTVSRVKASFACFFSSGFIAFSAVTFSSLDNTIEELNKLQEDKGKLRLEIAEHQAHLQVKLALMTEEGADKESFVEQSRASFVGPSVDIHIKIEGCEDPNVKQTENTCGFAYIEVNGIDFSLRGRGYNVVVVDGTTGKVLVKKTFETHGSPTAGDRLKKYLDGLNGNKIVLVTIQDEGSNHVKSALDALKRLGATDPELENYRGSFALVGYAGVKKPSWITQRGLGPSEISLKIPLIPQPH